MLELPAQAAKQVLQPLAELLPAQAAAELAQLQPGSWAALRSALAELHNTMTRRWTRIRTRRSTRRLRYRNRTQVQKTSVRAQPLAELQRQWSLLQPLAGNQTVKVIPTHIGDRID